MNEETIEQAIEILLASPALSSKIDRRLKYDLINRATRTVSPAKMLMALYDAGMLKITDGNE